jgi:membrane protease YdiL (CAAX protease family)
LELERHLAKLNSVQNTDRSEFYSQLPYPEPADSPYLPTPNDPPWNAGVAFGVWVASVLLIIIIPGLVLLPYLVSESMIGSEQIVEFAKTDITAIFLQIIAILPAHFLTLLLAWFVATRARRYKLRDTLGLERGGFKWWHYVLILVGFFVVAAVVGNFFPEQENDLLRILRSSRSAVYVVAFMATFTAPFVEELVYRGLLYSAFQRTFGVAAAFLFVTFLFVVVHVPQYYPSFSTILLLVLLSVILTLIRVVSGNLLPCIILHTLFNALQSVLLILEPYITPTTIPDPAVSIFRIFH